MTEYRNISTTLRAIRANLDLTQEQLAERLGVSFASINRWEGGVTRPQKAAQKAIAALAVEAGVDTAGEPTETAARVTRRRAGTDRRIFSLSTKPMEEMLWSAARSRPRGERRPEVQRLPASTPLSQAPFGRF